MPLNEEEHETLSQWLGTIGENRAQLNDWERGFFDDQVKRFEQYGNDMFLSRKQWAALKKIHSKITGERGEEPPPANEEDYYG